jgi:chromosome partitioning protein
VRRWAVANQKGGVGKTTTAVSLAGLLAERGHKTLLVDLDPHGSASAYFGLDPERLEQSLYTLIEQHATGRPVAPERAVVATGVANLSLLPASTALATVDRRFGVREGMGRVVSRILDDLGTRYDYAILDCPPVLGVLMVNALAAADRLIVPVQTEHLALLGLQRMMATLAMIERSRQSPLPATIVATLVDLRTRASVDSLERLRREHPDRLWPGEIPVDTRLRDAARAGSLLTQGGRDDRAAGAYRMLLEYLLGQEKSADMPYKSAISA